jgi:hypothetical protein
MDMKELIRTQPDNEDGIDFVFSIDDKSSLAQLEWEGDDEFSLNGEMYDVIEKKTENNKLLIRCLNDAKETTLVKKYSKMNYERNTENKTAWLIKLVSSSYLFEEANNIFFKPVYRRIQTYFYSQNVFSLAQEVLTPPPRYC